MAAFRHSLSERLTQVMGDEGGAYASAMLLGTKDFIAEDDLAAFRDLGIAHILSVSGFHVGVLSAWLLLLLRPLPISRKARTLAEAVLLGLYCVLTGGNAPVLRAVTLLLLREFTRLCHRQILPLHLLCTSALLQLAANPTLLTSASFQLTYCAMLGLLLVFPWLKDRCLCRTHWGKRLWEAFAASLSAQLGLLLPQLYWFGELPLLSILLNMAVIPLSGALMTLYWVTLAALPVPLLRVLAGTLAAWGTTAFLFLVRCLAALELGALETRQAGPVTFAGWCLLLFCLSTLVPAKLDRFRRIGALLGALLIVLILIPLPQTACTYTQFDVGDADAAILQDGDTTVVIDLGEDGQAISGYLQSKCRSVDLLILTHLHTAHAGGLRDLLDAGISIEVCCLPAGAALAQADSDLLPLIEELAATGTEIHQLSRGDVIELPRCTLTVLWPEGDRVTADYDANDVCLVMQADIRGVTLLLTGDITGAYENHVAIPSDILKVAHHGSTASTSDDFLALVDPQLLLLSNRMESRQIRMEELAGSIPLYSTAEYGAVTLSFPGNGVFCIEPALP